MLAALLLTALRNSYGYFFGVLALLGLLAIVLLYGAPHCSCEKRPTTNGDGGG